MAFSKEKNTVRLANGQALTIKKPLGDGGQGIVYKVDYSGKEYALKWYKSNYLKDLDERHKNGKQLFKENIQANIDKGSPNDKFLWPEALTEEIDGCFGYIMKLRPQGYYDFNDVYNNKVPFKSFRATVESALGIVNAFSSLHKKGYFYLDLNGGNFFIDTKNGDVLICDNDNVTAEPKYNLGLPGYIAPELVRGEKGAKSNALTDAHSLAVVLFRLFMRHDPLMGRNYCSSVVLTAAKEKELYGTKPVFIFDPADDSNRPVLNLHTNPIKLWPIYPEYVRKAFIETFCEGMKTPAKRLIESAWAKVLLKLSDDILTCTCGTDILWSNKENAVICPKCGVNLGKPLHIDYNGYSINLFPGNKIYSTHIDDDFNKRSDYGLILANKQDPKKWGIKNMSGGNWSVKKPSGETVTIASGKIISIAEGTEIELPGGKKLIISA